jgi:hypothetical protein
LTPQDLKLGVTDALNALLQPIREEFHNSPEFQESLALAYPKPEKKVKKVKDKGSKYPAGKNPNMKTAEQGANVLADDGVAEDIIANGQGTGSGGQSQAQIQSVGKGVEDALNKLNVSDTPK